MTQDGGFGTVNRRHRPCGGRSAGFTLIELVMVVAIIGVLSTLAIPNLTKLAHKSRRSEAYQALHAIAVAQSSYFTQEGRYADTFDAIGFQIPGGQQLDPSSIQGPYYTYTLAGITENGVDNANYRATATGDIDPTDPVLDVIIIENNLTVLQ
jgi:prepilin-type N-terminal cleavage/methylation domain-containing protein